MTRPKWCIVQRNGKHTNEYLILRYEKEWQEYRKKTPREMSNDIKDEIFYRNLVIKDFSKEGMITNEHKSNV